MATEVPRCSDCGTALKSVPTWLANAKASFTCSACPRRSSRGAAAAATARLDRPVETSSRVSGDDTDLDTGEIEEMDEDADLDIGAEELDDVKEDADL